MADVQTQTTATIEAHALARHVRMSPQKARLVMDLIRGAKAQDALQTLRYTPKRAGKHIEKVLRSAIANAERKAEDSGSPLDVDQLFVSTCYVRGALEADSSCADGPGLSLPEAHGAFVGRRCRAPRRRCRTRGVKLGRSRSREGRARHDPARTQGFDRQAAVEKGEEVMGQKTHPYGFRLGYNKPWKSRWYADRDYADLLHEDVKLRRELKDKLKSAGISSIDIERAANKLVVRIYTARPGIIIGRKGAEIDKLKQEVQKRTKREVHIDIQEVHRPELDAQLVAESIALQLEKRVAFRRAMRKAVDSALRFGCKGIKVRVAGRLNGAEIARKEWYLQGRLPLQTLRADIDYGTAEAQTTYGVIGVKCWVYQGENVPKRASKVQKERDVVAAA